MEFGMKVGNKHPTGVIVVCMKITGILVVINKWQVCYVWYSSCLPVCFLAGYNELHWDGKQTQTVAEDQGVQER